MELKIKRRMTLGTALEEIEEYIRAIRDGTIEIDGRKLSVGDDVELHVEFETKGAETELEFEIKWQSALTGSEASGAMIPQEEVWEAEKRQQPPVEEKVGATQSTDQPAVG